MIALSSDAVHAIERVHGAMGSRWIEAFPVRMAEWLERWSLVPESCTASANGAVVAARQLGGGTAILKSAIDPTGYEAERSALEVFDGRGAVRLLDADAQTGALLLERVDPGRPLSDLVRDGQDESATRAAVDVARRLHGTEGGSRAGRFEDIRSEALHTLERHVREHGRSSGPIPVAVVERAAAQLRELRAMSETPVVLHGDFHHENILSSSREPWLTVDPKGRIGEAESEFAAFMRNPIDQLTHVFRPRAMLSRRLDVIVEHGGFDRDRLLAWAQSLGVVAACWALEDGEAEWDRWSWVTDQFR